MTTRQEVIRKFYDDLEAAERYREKQMEEPLPAGAIKFTFPIEIVVYLRVRDEPTRGMVTDIDVHPYGAVYHVVWGDTRQTTPHYDFELSTEPPASY